MRTKELLSKQTATDIFTAVYVLVDDYLQVAQQLGRFNCPENTIKRQATLKLLTIVLVGEVLQQKNQGLWYLLVKTDYRALFPVLPELSRFYRISRNFERIYADLALLIAEHDGVYLIDSQPIPICLGQNGTSRACPLQRDFVTPATAYLVKRLRVVAVQASSFTALGFTPFAAKGRNLPLCTGSC